MLSRRIIPVLCVVVCVALDAWCADGEDAASIKPPAPGASHLQVGGAISESGRSRNDFLMAFEDSLNEREAELEKLERRLLLSQRKLDDKVKLLSGRSAVIPSRVRPIFLGLVLFGGGVIVGKVLRPWRLGRTVLTRRCENKGVESREEGAAWNRLSGACVQRPAVVADTVAGESADNRWQMVNALSDKGFSPLMIARHLEMEVGEVQLVLNLIRSMNGDEKNRAVFHPSHS